MKKYSILIVIVCFFCISCSRTNNIHQEMILQTSHVEKICELATMKCYFHNVAKYTKDDASGALWWKKDRKFWIEYEGIVTIGVDAALVKIEVDGENVTITIPPAKVLDCKVDAETLNKDSFIVAKNSAKVEAEHQTEAFQEAQAKMQQEASEDTVLLATAQQQAQKLLKDYVNNFGSYLGKDYKIKWVYLEGAEKFDTIEAIETIEEIETIETDENF